jgi:hypothetical protein
VLSDRNFAVFGGTDFEERKELSSLKRLLYDSPRTMYEQPQPKFEVKLRNSRFVKVPVVRRREEDISEEGNLKRDDGEGGGSGGNGGQEHQVKQDGGKRLNIFLLMHPPGFTGA